jgi:hypothetical protein
MKESFDDIVIKWEVIGREMFASHQGRRVCFEVYRQPLLRIVLSVEDVMQLWKNKSKNAMTSCRHYMLQVLIWEGLSSVSGTARTFAGRSLLGRIAFYGLAPVLW